MIIVKVLLNNFTPKESKNLVKEGNRNCYIQPLIRSKVSDPIEKFNSEDYE
jgi:hypothetical protein